MATYYWVGGAGTWDATTTTNWATSSGGAGSAGVPTYADDVIFDANSNIGSNAFAVTVNVGAVCRDFSTGGAGGALDGAMTLTLGATSTLDVFGSLTFPATNLTWSPTAGSVLNFRATTAGKVVTTNGVSLGTSNIVFQGVGGGWTLGSALSFSGILAPQAGTFNTGNYNVTTAYVQTGSTLAKTLNFGSSTITAVNPIALNMANPSSVTLNAGTSTYLCTNTTSAISWAGGGLSYCNVTFSAAAGGGTKTINGANTFVNLTFIAPSVSNTTTVTFDSNVTVTGTLTVTGAANADAKTLIASSVAGTRRTITANAVSFSYTNFRDINAAGTASPWLAPLGCGDLGNNLNITFDSSDLYWIGGSGNWNDGTKWSKSSGGAAANAAPSNLNNVIFDANSNIGSNAFAVTVTGFNASPSLCKDFSTGGAGGALDGVMTLTMPNAVELDCWGSMTLPAANFATSITNPSSVVFQSTTAGNTFTTNGNSLANLFVFFNGANGSWTLGSAITVANLYFFGGTFNSANYSMTSATFNTATGIAKTVNLGSSTVTLTSDAPMNLSAGTLLTFNANTSSIVCNSSFPVFNGAGYTFYDVNFSNTGAGAAATIIGANTFNNFTVASPSSAGVRTLAFQANQTINGTLTIGTANTPTQRISVATNSILAPRTITAAAIATLSDVDFQGIIAAGASGTWSGTRLGNNLYNTNITFPAAKTVYWSLAAGGNWSANAWATSSAGTPNVVNFPLCQDKAIFDNAGLNTSATVTIETVWNLGELDFSTRSNAMTLASSAFNSLCNNLTLSSAVSLTGTSLLNLYPANATTLTITSAGVTIPRQLQVVGATGIVKLADNLNANNTSGFVISSGNLDLNNKSLTVPIFSSSNGNTRSIAFGTSGSILLTGNNANIWNTNLATGFTYTGTSNVTSNYAGAVGTRTFTHGGAGGASEATALNLYVTAGSDVVNIGSPFYAKDLNLTGFSGSIFNSSKFMYGSLTIPATATVTAGANGIFFGASSGTHTLTTNSVTIDLPINCNGVGSTVQLGSNLVMGSTNGNLSITGGTFTTGANSYAITARALQMSGTNLRTVTLGNSTVTLNGNTTVTVLDATTVTNLTFNANTSNIIVNSVNPVFVGGGLTYYNLTHTYAGTTNFNWQGTNTFNNVNFYSVSAAADYKEILIVANQTINGTLTFGNSTSITGRMAVFSNSPGTARTLTVSTIATLINVDFKDITAAGTSGTWSGTNLGNMGGNTNINFSAPKTVYYVLAGGGTWTSNGWATSSGGAVNIANYPMTQDTAVIDDNSFAAGSTFTMNYNWYLPNITFASRSLAMTFATTTTVPRFLGSVILSPSVTVTGTTGTFVFLGGSNNATSFTFDTAGVSIPSAIQINVANNTSYTLGNNTTITNTAGFNHVFGQLNLNNKTLTCYLYTSSNTNTRQLQFGTGNITITGFNTTVLNIGTVTNFSFTGTPTVNLTYSGAAGTRTINTNSTASLEAAAVDMNISAGYDTIGFTARPRNLNFTGFGGLLTLNTAAVIYANLTCSSSMNVTASTNAINFWGTQSQQKITTNGITIDAPLTFGNASTSSTFQLQDNLTVGSTRTITLTQGTLDANNKNVTTGLFASTNSNTRSLLMGSGTWTLTGVGSAWNLTTSTGMTLDALSSTINLTDATPTSTINFNGGGLAYNNIAFTANVNNGNGFTNVGSVNNLSFGTPNATGRKAIVVGGNFTVNGTLTLSGSNYTARTFLVNTTGNGATSTITANAVSSLSYVDFRSITVLGNSSPWSGTNLGDCGVNTNIIFDAPKTVYWSNGAGGDWSSNSWALTSGGAVNIANYPLPQDNAIVNNDGSNNASSITFSGNINICNLTFASLSNTVTFNTSTFSIDTYGNLTLSPSVTMAGTAGFFFNNANTSITSAGVTFTQNLGLQSLSSGTVTLVDNLTMTTTATATLTQNTLNLNNNVLSAGAFVSSNSNVRQIAFGTGNITITGANATVWTTANANNFSYTGTPVVNFTYSGGTGTRTIAHGSTSGATEANTPSFNVTAGTDSVNLAPHVKDMNMTGFSGTLVNSTRNIYGNLILSSAMTLASGTAATTFAASSATQQVTSNGEVLDFPVTVGTGTSTNIVQFQDNFTVGSTRTFTLTGGTLDLNGKKLSAGIFNSNNSNVRQIDFNSGTLELPSSGSALTTATSTNLTITGQSAGLVNCTSASAKTLFLGSAYWPRINQGGLGTLGISSTGTLYNLTNTVQPATVTLYNNCSFYYFGLTGTAGNLITLNSSVPGSQATITNLSGGSLGGDYLSLQDSNGVPASTWIYGANSTVVSNVTGWVSGNLLTGSVVDDFVPEASEDDNYVGFPSVVENFNPADVDTVQATFEYRTIENINVADSDTVQASINVFDVEGITVSDTPIARGWFKIVDDQNPNWTQINNDQA